MPLRVCIFIVTLALIAGCSKKGADKLPDLHPVKGKLTKGGAAVGKGFVRFDPESNQNYMVQGSVDANGAFELETIRDGKTSKGAPAGTYKVFYTAEMVGSQVETTAIETARTYTIEAKPNDLTIDLLAK